MFLSFVCFVRLRCKTAPVFWYHYHVFSIDITPNRELANMLFSPERQEVVIYNKSSDYCFSEVPLCLSWGVMASLLTPAFKEQSGHLFIWCLISIAFSNQLCFLTRQDHFIIQGQDGIGCWMWYFPDCWIVFPAFHWAGCRLNALLKDTKVPLLTLQTFFFYLPQAGGISFFHLIDPLVAASFLLITSCILVMNATAEPSLHV